jgi:hypothetical protein
MVRSCGVWGCAVGLALALSACGAEEAAAPGQEAPSENNGEAVNNGVDGNNGATNNGAANNDTANNGEVVNNGAPGPLVGRCEYTNPFSNGAECKEYTGAGWEEATASGDCAGIFGVGGAFTGGAACAYDEILAYCAVEQRDALDYRLVSQGADVAQCSSAVFGCNLLGGEHSPGNTCEGAVEENNGGPPPGGNVFQPPYLDCRAALPGEPAGQGEGGQVCTQVAISGATEAGRSFAAYGACEVVLSQRPYYPTPIAEAPTEDPRLEDAAYMGELGWVTEQVRATGCVCCHSEAAPEGASAWDIDAGPLWIDTVADSGLAILAGLVDSTTFGAFPSSENNGFDRDTTGLPTTDVARMRAFMVSEYERRGNDPAEAAERYAAFGGPLYTQSLYEPTACEGGEGVGEGGALSWSGGDARYVYVLEADAANPGAPPNLDLPEGTVWLVDVDWREPAISDGFVYGEAPEGARQRFPAQGAPAALVSGQVYYIYALRDIGIPLTRCLFVAP